MKIIIKPKTVFSFNLKEIWQYRELFWTFAWRDIKVRYKQTIIGMLWAILQPFIAMIVFSVFFGRIAGISSGNIPYPIFVYTGLVFWTYFSSSLSASSDSMIGNQAIIQKIYFPRIILPISVTLVHLVDFFFAFLVLIGLMIYYHFLPTLSGILLILPSILITFLSFSGLGLFLSSLNVKYRDVRYALPYFIQILIFVTPVIYPPIVLGKYQWLWYLNPMAGVIETMRASLLGIGTINWQLLGSAAIISILSFVFGLIYFNKTERFFADII